ncbi:Beta-xylosidase, GH43 family [Butyrivibrio sp. ob235]|uniref:family 43 glycosylhydrolase n=1 Tax=Butyrivibrio sp. ob235 TaxID=1761780 RepID=UPI0008D22248|nr:family 43 glycosylhydrolase [Butyrivibrio sp. ob235]SEL74652.1 Beta-xylosidase, GH43 family [Butyrivibrio sp. ob235]
MKRRSFYKRGASALLSASVSVATLFGSLPGMDASLTAKAAGGSVDKTIRIDTKDVSTFNDTDGDGLGEFQGFGTSLCWWANRIGYSDELTQQAATYFFDENEGLGLNIGRYNVGGGDNTYDPKDLGQKVEVPRNKKAKILTADRAEIPYTGSNMKCEENGKFANSKYLISDADFGFAKGDKVGKFNGIGWINELDAQPGQGGNLVFNFNAADTGEYTVKMLFTLSGDNGRGVGLRVDRASVSTETVEVPAENNDAEAETAEVSTVVISEETGEEAVSPSKENSEEITNTTEETGTETGSVTPENSAEENTGNNETATEEAENTSFEETTAPGNDKTSEQAPVANEEKAQVEETTVSENDTVQDSEGAEVETAEDTGNAEDTEVVPEAETDSLSENIDVQEEVETISALNSQQDGVVTEYYSVSKDEINKDVVATGGDQKLYRVTMKNVKLTEGSNKLTIGGINNDWTLDFVKLLIVKSGDEGVVPEGADKYEEKIDESSNPDTPFAHANHIVRSDSVVPGYCKDVTRIEDVEDPAAFTRYDEECGFAWNYDWDADKNQINVLKAAIAKVGADEFIAEAFSNSPPYFMTVSGCSSGNEDSNKDNLRSDSVNAFAAYMADVVEHWKDEGIIFQSATPMNEPYTNYWGKNSDKQEGCHFDLGESQSRIITAFSNELKKKGLSDIILSASDETSIDTAISSYKALSDEAKNVVTRIDTHTYSGSNRKGLRTLAEESGENLWMSEVDGAFTVNGAGEMSSALGFSERLITDLNGLMPSAWIIWDIIDTHISDKEDIAANETASKYDEAYNKYDNSESLEEWLENNDESAGKSLWGVAIADHSNQKVVLTKKYYSFGQYSRYIRPGYTLMGSEKNTVAAYDSKGHKLVIVATNDKASDKTWKFDLSEFRSIGENVTAIRTSGSLANGENWADVSESDDINVDKSGKFFTATAKGNSITTYIIDGVSVRNGNINPESDMSAKKILDFSFDENISDAASNAALTYYEANTETEEFAVSTGDKLIGEGALKLDGTKQQWINVKGADGKNILAGNDTITVNFFSKTSNNTGTHWVFYAAPNADAPQYPNEKYFAVMDTKNNNLIDVERYFNNGGRPATTNTPNIDNVWKMVTVVADSDNTFLYINGELKDSTDSKVALSNIFTENGILQIGKANWGGGEYNNILIDELSVYDGALTGDKVADLYDYYLAKMPAEPEDDEDPGVAEEGDSNLVLHFTFDSEEKGFSGRGAKATSNGGYELVRDAAVGKKAIKLGNNQWLDVKSTDGKKNVLAGLDSVTINYFSDVATSNTSWAFYAAPNANAQVSGKEKYLGIADPLNNGKIRVERFYLENQGRPATNETPKVNDWKMVTVVADKNDTLLYIDGELKSKVASDADLEDIFGGNKGILQIGKANWGGGEYSDMIMDDLAVFDRALTAQEIEELYENRDVEKVAYKERAEAQEEKDLGIRVTSVEPRYSEKVSVELGKDYSLLQNTGATLTFNNNEVKDDAVITWYDENGNRVLNTKDFKAGTYKLTGKLSYYGNPVVDEKADPYVIYNEDDGYYYMTSSWPAYYDAENGYDRVALRRSKTLAGLSEAEDVTVWKAHESGELSHHIWAPELHKIGSDWYVYFSGCCDNDYWSIRPYVLHCTDSSDLLNPAKWEEKGRFVNKDGGFEDAFDTFSLDMTMFTAGEKSYVIWAYKTDVSKLAMAELNTDEPWKLASDPIIISTPEYPWEMNGTQKINEGPAVLKRDGKIYVAFSGSTTGPEYCVGLLTADEESDLMNPDSWTKNRKAVLKTTDLERQYGPGHNSFTFDNKTGDIVIVYHARDEECYNKKCAWAGKDPLYDPCRNANMAILRFNTEGKPVFTSTEDVEMQDLADDQKTFTMTVVVGSSMEQLKEDAANVTIPNTSDVRGNITLPETGKNGSVITWKSSAPEIVSDEDTGNIKKGVVNRTEKDEKVTLTATFTLGDESFNKAFELTVKAKAGENKLTHYLFAYFTGEGTADGEQIYFAGSDDGLNWSAMNDGYPVVTSTMGEKGLRDPFIIRSPEGDKFYMIATDLNINKNGDWGRAQNEGSKCIMIWESTDLVNWGEQRMVEVAADNAGCTWAPEAFYDDETGEYIVFWASMISGFHKIWYATTRDFYTFSEPKVWIHVKDKNGVDKSIIDTSVIAVEENGQKVYYRLSKSESGDAAIDEGDPEKGKYEILERARSLTGEWTRVKSTYLNNELGVEGGTIFKFNDQNKWCMLLDNYGGGGYYPSVTYDIGSGEFTKLTKGEYSFPSTMRHGTVIGITDAEYEAAVEKWGIDTVEKEDTFDTTLSEAAIAHFTFDDEEKGFAGKGAVAKVNNGYDAVEHGDGKAVKLNKADKQYLTLTKEDGSSLLSGLKSFSVNYWSNSEVKNETQWLFYAAETADAPKNNYEKYIGVIDPLSNDSKLHVERYKNRGVRSEANIADISAFNNEWKMVTVVFYKKYTELYVNGELVSTVAATARADQILGKNAVTQIGKANWGGGEYTTAMVDDFSLFNRPVSAEEVKALYEGTAKLEGSNENENPSGEEDPSGEEKPSEEKPSEEKPSEEAPADKPETKTESEPETKPETSESGQAVQTETTTPKVEGSDDTAISDNSSEETIPSVSGKIKKIKKGKNKGKYQLVLKEGGVAKGLVTFKGKKYFFDKKGFANKGFHKVDGKKYYTDAKGKVYTGFKKIGGAKYYFDKDGVMQTGKVKIGKKTYHFAKNGKLQKITKEKK